MQRKSLYAIIVVIVAIVVVSSVAVVLLTATPRKLQVQLWYNSDGHYGPTEPAVAQVIKSSLEAMGNLSISLQSEPWATYITDVGNGRLPFYLLGWYPDYFDSDDYVSPFFTTSGAHSRGSFYNNTQMNTWISQEAQTTSDAQRAQLFWQIQNQSAVDVPYIPLWQSPANAVLNNTITNFYLHPVSIKWFIVNKPGASQLTVGTTDRISSLDPAAGYDYFSIEVMNQIFDTLLVYDAQTTTLLPGLATTVPTAANGGVSSDGLTYTYHLRTGVTFHDGTAFNATVMKWSINRAVKLDIAGSAAFLLYDVGALGRSASNGNHTPASAITTPDDHTIVFHLSHPVSFFNDLMAFSVSAPVSMKAYNDTGQQTDAVGKVVGTGPYNLTGYTANTQEVLTAYANYYNPGLYSSEGIASIPVMPTVKISQYSAATNLKLDIQTKAIDVAYRTLQPTDVVALQGQASSLGLKVLIGSSPQIRYLVFNVKTAPFDDVRLRQAIAYAVDRAAINSTVFSGLVTPIYSMVPPALPYSQPVFKTVFGAAPNLAQAKSLLHQIGYVLYPSSIVARDWL